MTSRLFVDTGVLVAAVNPRDPLEPAALDVFARITRREWNTVHTSDYVVAETLNFLRRKIRNREAELAALDILFGRSDAPPAFTHVHRLHSGRFAQTLDRFGQQLGRRLSFTDCSTLVLLDELRIPQLATFDRRFEGLIALVGPQDRPASALGR